MSNIQLLAQRVREQLTAGKNIHDVFEMFKAEGHSDDDINQALAEMANQSGQSSAPNFKPAGTVNNGKAKMSVPPPDGEIPPASRPTSAEDRPDATKVFVGLGAILIILGMIFLFSISWQTVTPIVRVLYVTTPMLLLFGLSAALTNSDRYADIRETVLGTAAIMFPFALGHALFEFEIIPEFGAGLIAISAFGGLVLMALLEFLLKKYHYSPLTLLMFYVLVGALLVEFEASRLAALWVLTLASVIACLVGFALLTIKKNNAKIYFAVGTIVAATLFPWAVIETIDNFSRLSTDAISLIFSLFSLFYFALSRLYFSLSKKYESRDLLEIKRLFEEVTPIVLILPLIFSSIDTLAFQLAVLVFGFVLLFSSIYIPIMSLLPVGTFAIGFAILMISTTYFASTLGWPLIVLICGFILIGLGFLVRHVTELRKVHPPHPLLEGLGTDGQPEPLNSTADSAESPKPVQMNGCLVLILVLLAIYIVPQIIWRILTPGY